MAIEKKSLRGAAAAKPKAAEKSQDSSTGKTDDSTQLLLTRKLVVAKLATAKLSTARMVLAKKMNP